MYEEHFGLSEAPFKTSPDPRYMYLTAQHKEALAKCRYAIQERMGIAAIYGDIGTGKTTVARRLFQLFRDDEETEVAMIVTPDLKTDTAFLRRVLAEFRVPPKRSFADTLATFQAFVTKSYAENKNLVLLVDEAHEVNRRIFKLLRDFLNFESDTQKFIQIVLLGQNELIGKIDRFEPIKSRIAMFGSLTGLSAQDTEALIDYRWRAAGGEQHPFDPDAVDTIFKLSRGLPRLICKISNESLIKALLTQEHVITSAHVHAAARELREES